KPAAAGTLEGRSPPAQLQSPAKDLRPPRRQTEPLVTHNASDKALWVTLYEPGAPPLGACLWPKDRKEWQVPRAGDVVIRGESTRDAACEERDACEGSIVHR